MGRPRGFGLDAAIDLATVLSWQKSYEGTSLGYLTSTIGVTSPSLYLAFGGEEKRYGIAEHLLRCYADVVTIRNMRQAALRPIAAFPADRTRRDSCEWHLPSVGA